MLLTTRRHAQRTWTAVFVALAMTAANLVGTTVPAHAEPGWSFTLLPDTMNADEKVVANGSWVVARHSTDETIAVAYNTTSGAAHTFSAPDGDALTLTSVSDDTVIGYTRDETANQRSVFIHDLTARATRHLDLGTDVRPVTHSGTTLIVADGQRSSLSVHDLSTNTTRALPSIAGRWYFSSDVHTDGVHVIGFTGSSYPGGDGTGEHLFVYNISTDTVREVRTSGTLLPQDLHAGTITGVTFGASSIGAARVFTLPVTASSAAEATFISTPLTNPRLAVFEVNQRWLTGWSQWSHPNGYGDYYIYDRSSSVSRPLYLPSGYSITPDHPLVLTDSFIVDSVGVATSDPDEPRTRLAIWRPADQIALTVGTPKTSNGRTTWANPGETVAATTTTLAPANATLTYQWTRDGKPISGATSATRTVNIYDLNHKLAVIVTATAPGYAPRKVDSPTIRIDMGGLAKITKPSITGTAKVGKTLTVRRGTWSPTPSSYTQQWTRDRKPIPGATATTYRLTAADKGKRVAVEVEARRAHYWDTRALATSMLVKPGTMTTVTPKVIGTAKVGKTLTVRRGTWSPSGVTFTQQWYRNAYPIRGATGTTRKLSTLDRGARMHVKVTARKSGYTTTSRLSPQTAKVLR